MLNLLRDNRLPISVSIVALIVATIIGIIPTLAQKDPVIADNDLDLSALEARITALEANEGTTADVPLNSDNARLRQEIDLIHRGLANQTGRVSRLKKTLTGIVDENGQLVPSEFVADEFSLAKRGLVNLTRRLNTLEDRMDLLDTTIADINRLQLQMQNVDRAFLRMRAAVSTLQDGASQASTVAENVPSNAGALSEVTAIEAKLDAILQALQD